MLGNYYYLTGSQEEKAEAIKTLRLNGNIKGGVMVKVKFKTQKDTFSKMKDTHKVEKETESIVRLCIEYSNMQSFKDQNKTLSPLPINEIHIRGYENLLTYNTKSDTYYLRAFTTKHIPVSKWFDNGVETTKDALVSNKICSESMVQSSNFNDGIFKIKLNNVIAIEIL